jgi:hypothetical protein
MVRSGSLQRAHVGDDRPPIGTGICTRTKAWPNHFVITSKKCPFSRAQRRCETTADAGADGNQPLPSPLVTHGAVDVEALLSAIHDCRDREGVAIAIGPLISGGDKVSLGLPRRSAGFGPRGHAVGEKVARLEWVVLWVGWTSLAATEREKKDTDKSSVPH